MVELDVVVVLFTEVACGFRTFTVIAVEAVVEKHANFTVLAESVSNELILA